MPQPRRHRRTRPIVNPFVLIDPALEPEDILLLLYRPQRRGPGIGDMRPLLTRDAAAPGQQYPSRRGQRLYYPDGRVTDLQGQVITQAAPQASAFCGSSPAPLDAHRKHAQDFALPPLTEGLEKP